MTIEQLLDCSASSLEQMTDTQIEEYFKEFLHLTRPALITKPKDAKYVKTTRRIDGLDKAQAVIDSLGINFNLRD